jgi:hypothetical protein
MHNIQNNSSITHFFTIFSLISVLLVLPLGFFTSSKARNSVSKINEAHIENVKLKQQQLLQSIMSAQKILSSLEVKIDDELNSLSFLEEEGESAAKKDQDESTESSSSTSKWKKLIADAKRETVLNKKSLGAISDDMNARLGALIKESKSKFGHETKKETNKKNDKDGDSNLNENDKQAAAEEKRRELDKQKRFVVKWHAGSQGVLTSERMRTAQEATIKYDAVGDVAKKLLSLPASSDSFSKKNNWLVLRQNGGENWLNCMTNDAEPQPGSCKN